MPTDSVYGDDIKLLDDLTRLKLKVIQKRLNSNSNRDVLTPTKYRQKRLNSTSNREVLTPTKYRHHYRRYDTPDSDRYEPETPPPPERRRDRFLRKMDKRNELLHKLWEELGDGGRHYRRSDRYLPPLSARYEHRSAPPVFALGEGYNKTGNTKKDLMELMLIQNAQLQQWLMTQTLSRRGVVDDDGGHHHYYYGDPRNFPLPPIKRTDAGNQYPQDFFGNDQGVGTSNAADNGAGRKNKRK